MISKNNEIGQGMKICMKPRDKIISLLTGLH